MADLFYPQGQTNRRATAAGLDILPATFGEGWSAAFEETLVRNPTASLGRYADDQKYYERTYLDEFGNQQTIPAVPSKMLSAAEANEQYGIKGKLKFDADTPEPVAKRLREARIRELERQDTLRRADAGLGTMLSAGVAGSLLDPLNIGLAFVPVVGPARQAALAARLGVAGGRVATGAIEGAVGAAILEPAVLAVARYEQADYTAVDSIANIVFGSVIGGGLHLGIGAIGDRVRGRAEAPPAARLIDGMNEVDQAAVLRTAVAQVVEGRPVNVTPVLEARTKTPAELDAEFISGLRREWAEDTDRSIAKMRAEGEASQRQFTQFLNSRYGPGIPTDMENSPIARLIDAVKEETDKGLGGSVAERLKSMEPNLKEIFSAVKQQEPKSLTPEQMLKQSIDELQANPKAIFEAARRQPQILDTILDAARALGEYDRTARVREMMDRVDERIAEAQTPRLPDRDTSIQQAATEVHIDPAEAKSMSVATERAAETQGPPKAIDEETARVEEEVKELERFLPEGTERAEATPAEQDARLFEKAWRVAAACLMRK